MPGRLRGQVAVVTGASRGAGKGIAVVLGEEGAVVYVTGRSTREGGRTLDRPGTIEDTADEVSARGGIGIPVRCDHTDDAQVEAVFRRVAGEQGGRLDLLVNNAWGGYELSPDPALEFWEIELRHWDLMFDAGLRAAVAASRLAAPLIVSAGRGLIVNITWVLSKPHGHAFYEVVKNATNKLTAQMADDLRPHGVAAVAVSPGFMHGERMNLTPERAALTESTQFVGRGVAALAADPGVLGRSGGVFTTPELARAYAFSDVDGRVESLWWRQYLSDDWNPLA
jgi:NAD(P)-dependent dehydrogenase (short-subunit alcohol dehydrogenase family)